MRRPRLLSTRASTLEPGPERPNRPLRWPRMFVGRNAGVSIVEFAAALAVFLMLIFGVFEAGRLLWIANALHYSTQHAARCASVNPGDCGDGKAATLDRVQAYAATLAGAGIPGSAFCLNASCAAPFPEPGTTCDPNKFNFVAASYQVPLVIPLLSLNPTLSAQSCFPK
jgi:Flp pilus assembly protein TadG